MTGSARWAEEVALSRSPALSLCQVDVTPTETPRAGHVRKPGSLGATEQKALLAPGQNGHSLSGGKVEWVILGASFFPSMNS